MKFERDRWNVLDSVEERDHLMESLLLSRGIDSPEKKEKYLKPSRKDLFDPFFLLDMKQAVIRIEQAIKDNQTIWIYGDYDVDGITSVSILMKYFEYIGVNCDYYIPDRLEEGYGINTVGIDYISEQGGGLIITVDCGINAFEEAEYARTKGIDLIITDHHEVEAEIPNAIAVINPKRGTYPFPYLAGCGVAVKIVQALSKDAFDRFLPNILDIAAVGTIADIVPLYSENRVLAYCGLQAIENVGLRSLIDKLDKNYKNITEKDVGYTIAPMINATGRIGNPKLAVELLLEEDSAITDRMAETLYALNQERQEQGREILAEAIEYVEQKIDLEQAKVLLVVGKNWHTGIIGITASRLVERYHRPVVILSEMGDELKGSARSIKDVSIYDILAQCKDLFLRFGGHEQAAGLTMRLENEEQLRLRLQSVMAEQTLTQPFLDIDYVISPYMIDLSLVEEIASLSPFGMGNSEPVFAIENVQIEDISLVGSARNHVRFRIRNENKTIYCIAFHMAEQCRGIRNGDIVSVAFYMDINEYRGARNVNLRVKSIHAPTTVFHERIQQKIERATARYLINTYGETSFTTLDDFDIMTKTGQIDVIRVEDLEAIKRQIFLQGIQDYSLSFNEPDLSGAALQIVYLPLMPKQNDAPSNKAYFRADIPTRNDLVSFYKYVKNIDAIDIRLVSSAIRLSIPNILICMELLRELEILSYRQTNYYVQFQWYTHNKKMALQQVALFNKLNSEVEHGYKK